jgi:GxxExxY protein
LSRVFTDLLLGYVNIIKIKHMLLHEELSEEIIKSFYKVYNKLGHGFLESVYENAMIIELKNHGVNAVKQYKINVFYENEIVGIYYADLIADFNVIIEIKAVESLHEAHESQLINYLKATKLEVGILLNFGKRPEFKRKIFSNAKKGFQTINP